MAYGVMMINVRLVVAIIFFAFMVSLVSLAYFKGYATAELEYITEIDKLRLDNKQSLLDQERAYNNQANLIIHEYNTKLELQRSEYESTIEQLKASNLSDVVTPSCLHNESDNNTKRVSKEDNTSNLRCYTEEQLLDKVKASMAIARECDQLAERYNALLEVCKQ